jgi:hypothetical protein
MNTIETCTGRVGHALNKRSAPRTLSPILNRGIRNDGYYIAISWLRLRRISPFYERPGSQADKHAEYAPNTENPVENRHGLSPVGPSLSVSERLKNGLVSLAEGGKP